MVPVIALVGRPNVGKSTLFNRLTKSRDAIVAEYAGLTRDRQYGEAKWQGRTYIVIDTGGISGDEEGIDAKWPSSRCRPSRRPTPYCSWSMPVPE
jgi:GTP-binding protein